MASQRKTLITIKMHSETAKLARHFAVPVILAVQAVGKPQFRANVW